MRLGILAAVILVTALLSGCGTGAPDSARSDQETTPMAEQQGTAKTSLSPEAEETASPEEPQDAGESGSSPETEEPAVSTEPQGAEESESSADSYIPTQPSTSVTPSTEPYYDGPLFDTHLHTRNVLEPGSADILLGYMDREGVDRAVCFNTFPSSTISGLMTTTRTIDERVVMLRGGTKVHTGEAGESDLRQYLQPNGPTWGFGEIGLWREEYQSVTFNSPQMQMLFKLANEIKGIVMIHMSAARWGRTTEVSEIEPSLQEYPDAIFLFHNINTFPVVDELMSEYPNVYFSLDYGSSFFQGVGVGYSRDGADKEGYLAAVHQTGVDYIVQRNLRDLTYLIQKYPDRIFWGTDFTEVWHFDESVTNLVIEISRKFIGQLPDDIREKYAYKNAEQVFGRFLSTEP